MKPKFHDISKQNREKYAYQGTTVYRCPAFDVHRKSRSMLHFLLSCDVNDQKRKDTTSRLRWLEKLGGGRLATAVASGLTGRFMRGM